MAKVLNAFSQMFCICDRLICAVECHPPLRGEKLLTCYGGLGGRVQRAEAERAQDCRTSLT